MQEEASKLRPTILVIEDEAAIRRLLKSSLDASEFRLIEAGTAAAGVELAAKRSPDVILLDLGLPDSDGMSVIETIRGWSQVPIIILSGRGQETIKVQCLEAGADDYVTKPFGVSELLARVKVALRRTLMASPAGEDPLFEFEQLRVDRSARKVWVHDEEVHLTPIEYKLLGVLIQHAGKVVTHRQLLADVWGAEYAEDSQYLRVYMGYLRRKIEPTEESRKILVTEPRIGYRLTI